MSKLSTVATQMQDVLSNLDSCSMMRLTAELNTVKDCLRESMQQDTKSEIERVIDKIEKAQQLTEEEKSLLHLWIVGDADTYIKMENNYNDWLNDLNRIAATISSSDTENIGKTEYLQAHGLLEDAIRTSADISNYLDKKERLEKFQTATEVIDSDEAKVLVDMLRAKIASDRM